MAKQTVNQGTAPTGIGGDTFRSGSAKLQANDDEIYNYLGDGANLNKLGTAAFKNVGAGTGNVMEVGAFGFGSDTRLSSIDPYITETTDALVATRMVSFVDNAQVDYGQGLSWGAGPKIHGIIGARFNSSLFHAHIPDVHASPRQPAYYIIRTSANTTVDANGFIKAASPIVQLFADRITANDEAKLQEITFEKLGVGDYLVKGSLGFAQQGWYVETPKDANGNVLFSVIYDTLENGDISFKTYKKKFDLETASIVADLDKPVDITEGRWIDIRLQQLPQPEINHEDLVFESATPPDFQPTNLAQAIAGAFSNGTEQ